MEFDNENVTFAWRDEFKRKIIAQNLINLFNSESGITPVVIDGPWGSGKTEFCHKFMNLSKEKAAKFTCVYVNAFQYDQTDDPLAMLITAISSLIKDDAKKKDLLKKAIPVAKVLGKATAKAALSWVLRYNPADLGDELSGVLSSEGEEVIDDGIKKVFENFEKVEENLKVFKDALAKITEKNKVVIVIDELDRCRPSFALSVLEKIKHVFDVKDVSFLLSTNVRQVQAIVKKQYGAEIDAETYLAKFFNFIIHLPQDHELGHRDYAANAFRLFCNLIESDPIVRKFCKSETWIHSLFEHLFDVHSLSLRDAERFFRNIQINNGLEGDFVIKENTMWAYVAFIMAAIYIYTFNPTLATRILRGKHSLEEISGFLHVDMADLKKETLDLASLILATFALDTQDETVLKSIGDEAVRYWEETIHKSFDWGREPGRGRRISIFQTTIRKMHFV